MILWRFAWYCRARGGYWAQVTASMAIFSKTKWVRCPLPRPTPDHQWAFYPFAIKTMSNGYIDEWHDVEPCWAVPFSHWVTDTIGTNDMANVLALIHYSRAAFDVWASAHHPDGEAGTRALADLRQALIPFANAKPYPSRPLDNAQFKLEKA